MSFSTLQQQALGLTQQQLVTYQQHDKAFLLQADTLSAFLKLKYDAKQAGFDLSLVSSYRSFERQNLIWNNKAQGLRPLLDKSGKRLNFDTLTKEQLFYAILYWSAAPGCSRHHWGTDIDIFDANQMPLADVELTPAECAGVFKPLHDWLDDKIQNNQAYGFFRPFSNNACLVSEEKWHLSFLPQARLFEKALNANLLQALWQTNTLQLADCLNLHAETIYQNYVCLDYNKLPLWCQASRVGA